MKNPAIYIMSNRYNGPLYVGVTSNLLQRVSQQYNCKLLVYYEIFDDMENAILREKQIKGGSRQKKLHLIKTTNPKWDDLHEQICQ